MVNTFSDKHPHDEDPILDAEGRCLICTRMVFDDERRQIIAICEEAGIVGDDSLPSQWGHDQVYRVEQLAARLAALRSPATTDDRAADQVVEYFVANYHDGDPDGGLVTMPMRGLVEAIHESVIETLSTDRAAIARLVEAAEGVEKSFREWDMLTLTPDGHGVATADAPWARELVANLRVALDSLPPSLKVATEEGEGGE